MCKKCGAFFAFLNLSCARSTGVDIKLSLGSKTTAHHELYRVTIIFKTGEKHLFSASFCSLTTHLHTVHKGAGLTHRADIADSQARGNYSTKTENLTQTKAHTNYWIVSKQKVIVKAQKQLEMIGIDKVQNIFKCCTYKNQLNFWQILLGTIHSGLV